MIVTPARVNLPLVSVPECAFWDLRTLEHAECANAETIGHDAFAWCKALTYAVFGNVRLIRTRAFYACSALERAEFARAATIGRYAFEGCPFQPEVTP